VGLLKAFDTEHWLLKQSCILPWKDKYDDDHDNCHDLVSLSMQAQVPLRSSLISETEETATGTDM